MKITQMKFQKIVVKAFVILSAIALFYAVAVFATPFYQFTDVQSYADMGEDLDITGFTMFNDIQPFNRTFFTLSLVSFLVSLVLLVFFSQSRRNYYLSNVIASIVNAVCGIGMSVFALLNILTYRTQFVGIDFNSINENESWKAEMSPINSSTWSFDLGIIIFVLLAILSIALIINLIWKKKAMADDMKKYAKVDTKIREKWAKHEQELLEEAEKYES